MNKKSLGTIIKKYRSEKNMTQNELADKLNVSVKTVSSWECGQNYPDIEMLVKIKEILGVGLDEMVDETEKHERIHRISTTVFMGVGLIFAVGAVLMLVIFSRRQNKKSTEKMVMHNIETVDSEIEDKTEGNPYVFIRDSKAYMNYNGDDIVLDSSTQELLLYYGLSAVKISECDINSDGRTDFIIERNTMKDYCMSVVLATNGGYRDLGLVNEFVATKNSHVNENNEHVFTIGDEEYSYKLLDCVVDMYKSVYEGEDYEEFDLTKYAEPHEEAEYTKLNLDGTKIIRKTGYSDYGIPLNMTAQITVSVVDEKYVIDSVELEKYESDFWDYYNE